MKKKDIKKLPIGELVELKRREKYSPKNYKSNKNCIPVTYKGKEYKSKAQCIVLEKITRRELEEYLAAQED